MTTISAKLRAAIFSGAVGLLPSIALADSGSGGKESTVPDHAAAEARSVGDTSTSSPESPAGIPDHAATEARSVGETTDAKTGAPEGVQEPGTQDHGVPDHAAAERRGAPEESN
jgi:hypothetical protein